MDRTGYRLKNVTSLQTTMRDKMAVMTARHFKNGALNTHSQYQSNVGLYMARANPTRCLGNSVLNR